MKDKFKNAILYIGIFYMVIIVLLMVKTYGKMITNVELSVNTDFQTQLNEYKNEVTNLNGSTCKNYINSLIQRVEKDVNTSEINLQKYYEDINSEDSYLSYYSKGVTECNSLTSEVMQEANMPLNFLVSPILSDEMIGKYVYQYELSLKDYRTREVNQTYLIPVENNVKIQNELQVIKKLLDIIDWGKEV